MVNRAKETSQDLTDSTQPTQKRKLYDISNFSIKSLLMPSRKRSKPSAKAHVKQNEAATSSHEDVSNSESNTASENSTIRKQRSWYGTWPLTSKSGASTELARESILAAKPTSGTSVNLSKFDTRSGGSTSSTAANTRPPSMYVGKSKETSSLSTPDDTVGGDNIADNSKSSDKETIDSQKGTLEVSSREQSSASSWSSYIPIIGSWGYAQQPQDPVVQPVSESSGGREGDSSIKNAEVASSTSLPTGKMVSNGSSEPSGSWFPLWSSSSGKGAVETQTSQIPATSNEESASTPPTAGPAAATSTADSDFSKGSGSSRRWFSGFSLSSTDSTEGEPKETQSLLNTARRASEAADVATEGVPKFKDGTQPASGSTWMYFGNKSSESVSQESGKVAIIGDKSQNKPEPATIRKTRKKSTGMPESPSTHKSMLTPETIFPTSSQHILLPELRDTYKLLEDPSIIQQIARLMRLSKEPPVEHVSLVKDPTKIKKAVAIGVHGWLPQPPGLIARAWGPNTGTSELLRDHAAAAIYRWTRSHGYRCEVEVVQLEYHGNIAARVENLWKLLVLQVASLQNADVIMFACHSQGVPVSVMLAAKLIDLGILSRSTKIGICAMAGVNLGPYHELKNTFGPATKALTGRLLGWELFDLVDSDSVLSKTYIESLRKALRFGTRITYVGSLDDQFVPLESSTFTPVHHPYIFRAVFADGHGHKPDFITKLIAFTLKLRNMGVKDHGLIRELSAALAGPVLSGRGHSVIYDDPNVYDLAVQHTLETTSVGDVDLIVNPYNIAVTQDPYFLPFAIRGVLDEDLARTELSDEAAELIRQFDAWQPTQTRLLDVKLRLRVIKSML